MNTRETRSELLGSTVRVGDVRVGVVTAVLTNGSNGGAFGLEVSAQGGDRWFLPRVAADVDGPDVCATSALFFGGPDQLDAYVRRGAHVVRRGGEALATANEHDDLPAARPADEHGVLAGRDGGTTMS